jgi:hypothetical protein
MDASDGSTHHGNGHADPAPESLPSAVAAPSGAPVASASPAPEAGAPEPLIVVDTDVRDEKGRMKPGRTLNPKGRPPGIVNRNTQLNRGFEAFRANPELCKEALKKYKIRIRNLKAEQLLITLAFAKSIIDKDDSLLKWCGEHAYLGMTPAAAGIVINNTPQATAAATAAAHNESYGNARKLLADEAGRELLARCAERLASGSVDAGTPRHVRQ